MAKAELDGSTSWLNCYTSEPPYWWCCSPYYAHAMGRSVLVHNNSIYEIGIYQDSLKIDGQWLSGSNSLLAKFNSQTGKLIWAKNIPGNNMYSNMKINDLNNDTFLIGSDIYQNGTYFFDSISVTVNSCNSWGCGATILSKTDTGGKFLWAKVISEGTRIRDMAIDTQNNICVVGIFSDSCKIGQSSFVGKNGGIFLLKCNSQGTIFWSKIFHNPKPSDPNAVSSVAVDYLGSIFITGVFHSDTLNFQDTLLIRNGKHGNAFISKFSESGKLIHAMNFTNSFYSSGYDITTDDEGSVYWAGRFYDTISVGNFTLYGNTWNTAPTSYFIKIKGNSPLNVLDNHNQKYFSIFPNPTTGNFTIQMRNYQQSAKLSVRDVLGNCLLGRNCQGEASQEIDLSNQPKGIYFVELLSGSERIVRKVAVQ